MKKQYIVIGAIVVLIALVVFALINRGGDSSRNGNNGEGDTSALNEPFDVMFDFYDKWLNAANDPEANRYNLIAESDSLTADFKGALIGKEGEEQDPLFCSAELPSNVRARVIYEGDNEAEMLVVQRPSESLAQASVFMTLEDRQWKIRDIQCNQGEQAPEKEFSFDQTGYLLKDVPEPLDSQYWHLVFEQDGQMGHTVPLFFSQNSLCIQDDGTGVVCDESQFSNATQATVRGEMTESGLNVQELDVQ